MTSAVRPRARAQYRSDLDGLRGVAIALVVCFHVWMGRVSGGVDVFLVLSGFFFTGMLLRRVETHEAVGYLHTARRTARRLLPALAVVLTAVAITTVIVRPYTQWGDIAAQTVASALYYQNWHLANAQLDYAAADPSVSPLQHLWSMSVQGQFYVGIVIAVGLWAWWSRRRQLTDSTRRTTLFGVLLVIGAVSLWYAIEGAQQHQSWTYYDTAARVWELLAGAALAVAAPWIKLPKILRTVFALAGIVMVFACGLLIDGAAHFPGAAALFPVASAVFLITSGMNVDAERQPWVNRLLATKAFTELGAIAYALYLAHWPILIFVIAERGTASAGFGGGLLIIGISLVVAWLIQRLVETPLRRKQVTDATTEARTPRYRRSVGIVVGVAGAAVLISTIGWQVVLKVNSAEPPAALDNTLYPGGQALTDGLPVPSATMRPSVFEGGADAPSPTYDGCITPDREVRTCIYGDADATRTIALVGGSHSEHWLPALQTLADEHSFRIVTYLKEGCPLVLVDEPSYAEAPFPECHEWTTEVLDRLTETRPDWIFTISTRFRPHEDGDFVPPEWFPIFSELQDRDLNVLALRDTPRLRRAGVFYRAVDCLAHHGNSDSCGIDRSVALDPVDPGAELAASYPNVFPFDLSDGICLAERCRVVEGNVLVYRDEHHLTASYARSLAPALGRHISEITHWW
ncbi:acyltransferase family protein [Nocardia callitridis]|uniref:Acyltransferase family protein n=1 Tax=Nocardia callitridis TaxID=648753 RepID=A0ABP9KTI2_9NOCA